MHKKKERRMGILFYFCTSQKWGAEEALHPPSLVVCDSVASCPASHAHHGAQHRGEAHEQQEEMREKTRDELEKDCRVVEDVGHQSPLLDIVIKIRALTKKGARESERARKREREREE